jgi:hypothetical protein
VGSFASLSAKKNDTAYFLFKSELFSAIPRPERFLAAFSLESEYRFFPTGIGQGGAAEIVIHKSGQQHFEKGIGQACR